MSILLFANLKGGVAKTTNAVAVAECLAYSGKPTLLIDADHQCAASELLLGESRLLSLDSRKRTLHDLLSDMLTPEFDDTQFDGYVAKNASNIHDGLETLSVIPCSFRIGDFQTNYAKSRRGFRTSSEFKRLFEPHRRQFSKWLRTHFAYTVIDCPPSLALQVKLLLRVSDTYIMPCQPNRLSIRGADWLRDRIERDGYKIDCLGILWSMCRGNDQLHKEVIAKAAARGPDYKHLSYPFETVIPLAASISHAVETVGTKPASFRAKYGYSFAKIYENLVEEIIRRLEEAELGNGDAHFHRDTRAVAV